MLHKQIICQKLRRLWEFHEVLILPNVTYLLKVKNGNKRAIREVFSDLIIETPSNRRHWRTEVGNSSNRLPEKQNLSQNRYWLWSHKLNVIKINHLLIEKKNGKPLQKSRVCRGIAKSRKIYIKVPLRKNQTLKQLNCMSETKKIWNKSLLF